MIVPQSTLKINASVNHFELVKEEINVSKRSRKLFEAMRCGEKGGCGHNSVTYCHDGVVHKVVTGKRKLKKNEYQLTREQANEIKGWLDTFIAFQRKAGIPIPATKTAIVYVKDEGRWGIWIEQNEVGPDLATIIKKENDLDNVLFLCRQILECFILPAEKNGKKGRYLEFGLDLKAENFCLSCSGDLLLVDLFPPHVWVEESGVERAITEMFPVTRRAYETKLYLLFTGEGMRLNALAQLGRLRPDLFKFFKKGLKCEDLVAEIIEQAPEFKFEKLEDAYKARAVVCDFACQNGIGPEHVDRFFELTHVEDDLLSKEEVLCEIGRFRKGRVL